MAHYRKIDTRIWNDAKFRGLSDAGKLCFIFVLTHPHLTALGAMRATVAGLAEELGWKPEAFREAFREALSKGLLKHDPKACFVWVPNFLKYNGPESPNVVRSWVSALDLLPECNLKSELLQHVKDFTEGLTEGFQKALPEAFAKGMPYQEQEQEQEQDKEKTPSTTSQGSRGTKAKKARVDDLGAQPPMEVLNAVGQIVKLTPKVDTDGREIRAIRGEILTRVQTILTEHPSATPEIMVMAWENYLKTRPTKIKAPQYFFGRQEDQGATGANWYPYAKAIFIARQQEVALAPSA